MPTKRPQLIKGEIYHVILRGIDNRQMFLDVADVLRFIFDLVVFNNLLPVVNNSQDFFKIKKALLNRDVTPIKWDVIPIKGSFDDIFKIIQNREKKPIVEILAMCLMPTHIHLLLRPLTPNGISLFIQKLGGYSTYFNKKYNRFGSLIQRPFRVVHIKTQEQLEIIVCYIHTNPVELVEPKWKEKGIRDSKAAMQFLEKYWCSSLPDYLGEKNLSRVINRDFVDKIFGGPSAHRQWIKVRLFQKRKLYEILTQLEEQKIALE